MLFSLQKICSTVEVSERSVEKLLAEVSQLKEEIKRKKQQTCSGKLNKCNASLSKTSKIDSIGRSQFWYWGSQNSSGSNVQEGLQL